MEANQQRTVDYVINDPKSLYEILKNLNINISLKDIKQPNMDTYVAIYKAFLEMCLMIKAPIHDEIPGDAITNFSDEIVKNQAESFKFLQLYSFINYLYSMMGSGYTMTEIFNPSKKLYYKQISSVINFARFLFDELNEYGAIQNENKIYMEKCNAIVKESDEIEVKIDALQLEARQKKPLIENAKKRISALKEKQNKIREMRNKLNEKNDAAKKEENTYNTEKSEYADRVNSMQKKMELYEMLLVKSPDRLKKDMEKNEARIIDLEKLSRLKKSENEALRQDIFERERFVEVANGIKESFENFLNNEVQKANTKLKEIEKVQEDITSINFNLKELENLIDVLNKNKNTLELNIQTKTQEFEQKHAKLTKEEEAISSKIKDILNEMQQIEDECNRLKDEKNKIVKKTQEMMIVGLKQIEICEREKQLIDAKLKADETLMLDYQKEIQNKFDQLKRTQLYINDFLGRALEEFVKKGTITFDNIHL